MRTVYNGAGLDNTAAAQAWLMATPNPMIRDLILIGRPEDPRSLWLTNHEAPVLYSLYGLFHPAVIKRDNVTAKVGLEVQQLNLTWSPGNRTVTASTSTASPFQMARLHQYDNWPVRVFRALMPASGDADSIGCCEWWGGRVHTVEVERNQLVFACKSYLDVLTQKVPSTVIEVTNTLAGNTAVTLPAGDASIPTFACYAGSTENYIIADCLSPTSHHIYGGNEFAGGYMVFLSGSGATLAGAWSAIGQNGEFVDGSGNHHSEFELYAPLPWPPTPGVDTFYVSKSAPINLGDEGSYGFPYVPSPQTAV